MGFYMIQGCYTQTAIKHLTQHPENRSKAGEALVKALGGKLHQYYMCFGKYDFVAIVELPDDRAAAATSMALGGAGHLTGIKTTKLMTGDEAMSAMKAAGGAASSLTLPKGM
jgi:uncharacterized protein with GYD domain